MTKEEYLSLYEKFLAGATTIEENQLLAAYEDEFQVIDHAWDTGAMGNRKMVKNQIRQKLNDHIHIEKSIRPFAYLKWSAAAILILGVAAGLYFTAGYQKKQQLATALGSLKENTVLPGSNKAVLTLADGSVVNLENVQKTKGINQGNTSLVNSKDGLLVYTANRSGDKEADKLYNKISIPRGGQYQLKLPDGTQVWLNSASTLRFPTRFSGNERNVELTGEAYFEVAKNKNMPFKVRVNQVEVKVLGTHFNIMAYDDEQSINTTLLEGSVNVSGNMQHTLIRPGQQARFKKTAGSLNVEEVNLAEAVAWKNGNFLFADDDIETIMRKISRWYDVDVEYRGNLTDKNFAGSISRSENVSEVLKTLELTGTIHFKMEGRRIIVMP